MAIVWRSGLAIVIAGALHSVSLGQEAAPDQQAEASTQTPFPALRELQIVRSNLAEAPSTLTVEAAEVPSEPTRILDHAAAERLFGNSGLTLQWIGWEERGRVWIAVDEDGQWLLTGEQRGEDGSRLSLEGFITEIGSDYFTYSGTVKILGSPDAERFCNTTKEWRFAVTQNRKYWRLREFEWCDDLTDYIDIYF